MPKVSVIVPNYNHARFLPKRLDTIVGQTFTDFELLIMDDKSPDDSLAVIDPYLRDPRARLECNEVNSGSPYRQWNKGLALTTGEYVWIAESDDYADPAFLTTLVEQLDRHPSAGIAMCMSWKIDGEDRILGGYRERWDRRLAAAYGPNPFNNGVFFMNGRDFCAHYMSPWNLIPNASGALFRRSAFEAIGGPVTDMKICGDWFTYCKMLMHSDFVSVPDHLNYFRTHTTNVRLRTKATDFVREALEVREFLTQNLGQRPSAQTERMAQDFYAQMLVSAERTGPSRKTPLSRYPALINQARQFGSGLTAHVAKILLREAVARLIPRPRPTGVNG